MTFLLQVTAGLASTYIDGQKETDFDNLPPPPPELLQQQYLYGATPQQGIYTAGVAPQGKGIATFRPGAGEMEVQQAKQGKLSNIPVSSTPIQVEKRCVFKLLIKQQNLRLVQI